MKEKYEKDLKDARARELMYAGEVAMLEKDIKKQTAKAAAALKSLQEKADERLKMELEQKEKEAELKLKEVKEFAKAKLVAAIAGEKAAQLEEMAEANVNDEQLQSENRMLHMVLKHEQVIEELLEENERFRRILVGDLKISPEKFHSKLPSKSTPRGSDSFEGRRKQRSRLRGCCRTQFSGYALISREDPQNVHLEYLKNSI